MRRLLTAAVLVASAGLAAPAPAQPDSTSLTIYSTAAPGAIPPALYRPVPPSMGQQAYYGYNPWQGQPLPGYAMVKIERTLGIPAGRGTVAVEDVAALIDPTTVSFESLTDPDGTTVLEQNYQFDLVSTQKMLERYVGQTINLDGRDVKLLTPNAAGGVLVQEADGRVLWKNGYGEIRFPSLAEGLILKPTLLWDIASEDGGEQRARITYQTEGITWWADYNLIFTEGADANHGTLDVGAWVSILNQSGGTFKDAKLKLIAGDVHRAPQPGQPYPAALAMRARNEATDQAGFAEKAFFEYHLYTLGRPATIPENSTKQIELFDSARGVEADKVLVYYGLGGWVSPYGPNPAIDRDLGIPMNTKVSVHLRFRNSEAAGMGMPLPSGRVRVSQLDEADQTLEFIGEDVIDHTPRDEEVLIKLGEAFDVVGERVQSDFKADYNARWLDETIEIKVRNHKDQPVDVIVKENLYRWVNWEIAEKTTDFEKIDARTIHFPVAVPAGGETTVRYKVHYTW